MTVIVDKDDRKQRAIPFDTKINRVGSTLVEIYLRFV